MQYVVFTRNERFQARMILLDMVEGVYDDDPEKVYAMPDLTAEQDIRFRADLETAFANLWGVPVLVSDTREFVVIR